MDSLEKSGYDYGARRIIGVVSDDLPAGMAMNAIGHLAFSAGRFADNSWFGKEIIMDADGNAHRGISSYPVIILKATEEEIKRIAYEAKSLGLYAGDYPQEMFDTGPDDELVAAIEKAKEPEIRYRAVVLLGETAKLKVLTGHLKLYR